MAANNLGTAYIKIAPQMDGIQSSIANAIKGATKSGSSVSTAAIAVGNVISKGISVAMSAITNSVDTAIKRTDIINNFPKVMSNMGISADQAQKSIDILVQKLDGLPTALQDGAAAVQRFTSKNGDVQKSTDIFLALNNALLAGGMSTEQQATALEQLSQAYAKGKPDMMEWRSMQQAMPAQLRQIAIEMGYGADGVSNLGEALRKGEVSMDDFMDTIIKLNKEGTSGFLSFEEQARNSTDGIGTAMTNVRNRIAAALQKIINAFGSKDIAEAINKFSSGFSGIADWISKYVVPVIKDKLIPIVQNIFSALKNVVEFIAQNEWVQHILLNALNIFIAFKVVTGVTDIIKGAISSIAGLVTTISGVATKTSGVISGLVSGVGKLASALGPVGLAGVAGLATAAIVGVQAAIIGSEIDTIRATTAARDYARSHYDIQQAAESAKRAEDLLKQSINDLKTAEDAATNAEIAAIQARQDQNRYLEEMNRLKAEGKQNTDEYRLAELEYTKAIAQEKQANQELKTAQEEVAASKQSIDDLNSSGIYKANLVLANLVREKGEYGNLAAMLDELKTKTLTYKDEQGNMVTASLEKSQEMVEGLAAQLAQGDATWSAIVAKAQEEGISLAEACAKYGTEAGSNLQGNFAESVRYKTSLVTEATQEAGKQAIQKMKDSTSSAYDVGKNLTQGAANGINDGSAKTSLFGNAASIIKAAVAKMKAAANEHSPSKETAEIGKFLSLGLAKGIDDYADEAINAAESMTERTIDAMNGGFGSGLSATQLQPYDALASGMNGSGGQVTQYNTFNQVDTNLDMTEISKRLGWQVATAL